MNAVSLTSKPVRQRGDVIRSLRRAQGLRPGEFARRCGFDHPGSLTNIEGEVRQASWEALHRIARELAVPVSTLLRDPDEPQPAVADRRGAA